MKGLVVEGVALSKDPKPTQATQIYPHLANGPWNKSLNFIFPTKYAISKGLKFSHWPSKYQYLIEGGRDLEKNKPLNPWEGLACFRRIVLPNYLQIIWGLSFRKDLYAGSLADKL